VNAPSTYESDKENEENMRGKETKRKKIASSVKKVEKKYVDERNYGRQYGDVSDQGKFDRYEERPYVDDLKQKKNGRKIYDTEDESSDADRDYEKKMKMRSLSRKRKDVDEDESSFEEGSVCRSVKDLKKNKKRKENSDEYQEETVMVSREQVEERIKQWQRILDQNDREEFEEYELDEDQDQMEDDEWHERMKQGAEREEMDAEEEDEWHDDKQDEERRKKKKRKKDKKRKEDQGEEKEKEKEKKKKKKSKKHKKHRDTDSDQESESESEPEFSVFKRKFRKMIGIVRKHSEDCPEGEIKRKKKSHFIWQERNIKKGVKYMPLHSNIKDIFSGMQQEILDPTSLNTDKIPKEIHDKSPGHGLPVGVYLSSRSKIKEGYYQPADNVDFLKEIEEDPQIGEYLKTYTSSMIKKDITIPARDQMEEFQTSKRLVVLQSLSRWIHETMEKILDKMKKGEEDQKDLLKEMEVLLYIQKDYLPYMEDRLCFLYGNRMLHKRDLALSATEDFMVCKSKSYKTELRASNFVDQHLFDLSESSYNEKVKKKNQEDFADFLGQSISEGKLGGVARPSRSSGFSVPPRKGGFGGRRWNSASSNRGRDSFRGRSSFRGSWGSWRGVTQRSYSQPFRGISRRASGSYRSRSRARSAQSSSRRSWRPQQDI